MLSRVVIVVIAVNISACAYFTKRHYEEPAKVDSTSPAASVTAPTAEPAHQEPAEQNAAPHTEAVAATAPAPVEKTASEPTPVAKGTLPHVEASAPLPTPEALHKSRLAGPVPADKALGWLMNGNIRFVKGSVRKDGESAQDRARLAKGQFPHSIILSCSDSRVPPEVVFDQKLGEIFVIRTAAESLAANAIGSIEYAVEHLGSNLIVVMGHESCGGIKATLQSLDGADLGSPNLQGLVDDLKPHLAKFKGMTPSAGYVTESWANVEGVAKDLLLRSQILRDAITSGEVKIVRAMYHLDSGTVEFR